MAFEWTFPNYYYYFFYKICFVMLSCCPVYVCNFMYFILLLIILKVQTKLLLQIVWKAVECSDLSILIVITMPVRVGSSDTALRWSKVIVHKQQMHDFFCPLLYLLGMEVTNHSVVPNLKAYRQSKQTMRSLVIYWDLINVIKHAEYTLK